MLLTKGYVGNQEVSRIYLGEDLVYESAPPVGRVFNVGSGSGSLTVNMENTGADWYPLQPNDTFVIASGSYSQIQFVGDNWGGSEGNRVKVTSDGPVSAPSIWFNGGFHDVDADFLDGTTKNLTLTGGSQQIAFGYEWDDYGIRPVKNVWFRGFVSNVPTSGRVWNFLGDRIDHDFGDGEVAIDNVFFSDFDVVLPDSPSSSVNYLFETRSDLNETTDTGFIRNFKMSNGTFIGNVNCNALVFLGNTNDPAAPAVFEDIYIEGINPTNTQHPRLIQVYGCGFFNRIKSKNTYGNTIGMFASTRGSTPYTNVALNLVVDNTRKYSGIEYQTFAYQIIPGKITFGNGMVVNSSSRDTGDPDEGYTSTLVEVYAMQGGTVDAINCVAINPYNATTVGPFDPSDYNKVYADSTAAGVDSDMRPTTGSPLIGTGFYMADQDPRAGFDYYGDERPNPPSIGAVEPQ